MKKITLLILGLLLVSSVFVVGDDNMDKMSINIHEGWNLVLLYSNPIDGILSESEIKIEDFPAMFFYWNNRHKMYEMHPNNEMEKDGYAIEEDMHYMLNSAHWIYSTKSGTLKVERVPWSLSETKLSKGWNLLGTTEEMVNNKVTDFAGNCDIEKLYGWNSKKQEWESFSVNQELSPSALGTGMAIKVRNTCQLETNTGITPVPSLPN